VPLAQRSLLDSASAADRCTPDELLRQMSDAFDLVKRVISRIGAVWDELTPQVEQGRRLLAETAALAEQVGEGGRRDLDTARQSLEVLQHRLSADPLAVGGREVERVVVSLTDIHRELEGSAALMRELDPQLLSARQLLERLRAEAEEGRAANAEVTVKIAAPAVPAPLELPEQLDGELARVATLARHGAWRDARAALDGFTSRATALLVDAERIVAANRAPIEARNQFRSLLEAYKIKAARLGLVEDPWLEEIFTRAHDALYTAPTDLAEVAQLVRRYQEELGSTRPASEALQ
jgi:hypothetical protein